MKQTITHVERIFVGLHVCYTVAHVEIKNVISFMPFFQLSVAFTYFVAIHKNLSKNTSRERITQSEKLVDGSKAHWQSHKIKKKSKNIYYQEFVFL